MNWTDFIAISDDRTTRPDRMMEKYGVYPGSINSNDHCTCFMAKDNKEKFLIVTKGDMANEFDGESINLDSGVVKKCSLTVANSRIIRKCFAFTNPVSVGEHRISIGLGDRLGFASAGHIRTIKDKGVFPVLAQQSIRELNLTGRTYDDVLASAVWAVLQEGYKEGYGADGDHLKTKDEVMMALEYGFTMITLDCSEYINNEPRDHSSSDIGGPDQEYWSGKYLNKIIKVGDKSISINKNELLDAVYIYGEAIDFAATIYHDVISKWDKPIDFEISIDETQYATDVKAHFIIASELYDRGVVVRNMAPRFCGEFQKGIDYRGDIDNFKQELIVHNAIAEHFGYRLSIHSGSDKFSVFPVIGEQTKGKFHVKTAGTNWLEAMRVISLEDTGLFREMYRHSLKRLDDAKVYYHIFTNKDMVPDDKEYTDDQLEQLLIEEESRQAIHITYGYLLGDMDGAGQYLFRDRFFDVLHRCEETYYTCLKKHIGRHLTSLGI